MDLAAFVQHNDKPAVRFEPIFSHDADRVWRAITDADELQHWFPSRMEFEPQVGGTVTFSGDPNLPNPTGSVLTYNPPQELGFQWGEDEVYFEVTVDEAGRTQFILINVLSEENTAARNATGWTVCLNELRKYLDGEASKGPHSDDALPFQPIYDQYVANGFPSGAVIPGVTQ